MRQRFLNLVTAISSISFAIALLAIMPQSILAREWSKIASQSELNVAIKDNLRPLGFTDEKGNLTGLEVDIARKLGEELLGNASAVKLLPVTNRERLRVVLTDETDIAIARVAVTTSRSRIVDFSPYYYLDGTGIVTKSSQIEQVNGLSRSKIAVLNNSATIAVVRSKLPQATLIGVDSYQAALELLENNQADAFAGDRSILTGWTQEYPVYKLLPERLSGSALAIVMPKGLQYKELRTKVNQAIVSWKKSGWLEERIEYWGL